MIQNNLNVVNRKVALVDDDKDILFVQQRAIQALGYTIEFVGYDGSEIVESIEQGKSRPDLIIMDYRMGRMNGLEAASRIRRIAPSIEIILASADEEAILKA